MEKRPILYPFSTVNGTPFVSSDAKELAYLSRESITPEEVQKLLDKPRGALTRKQRKLRANLKREANARVLDGYNAQVAKAKKAKKKAPEAPPLPFPGVQ